VARGLAGLGAEVFLLDRAATRLRAEMEQTVAGIFVASVEDPDRLSSAIQDVSPDVTFNLAGYGVRRGEADVRTTFAVNALGAEFVARAVLENPPSDWRGQRLIQTGSQAEYGPGVAMQEDAQCRPVTPYGRSKLEGTERLVRFSRAHGLPAITARLFNVFGPGEPSGRLLPTLYSEAGGSAPIKLTSGVQERDFTLVSDVAEGLLRLGLLEEFIGGIVNLGTGRLTPVRRFVEIAAEELGIPGNRLEFGSLPDNPLEEVRPIISVERLRDATGWLPSTPLREGIAHTVLSFREERPRAGS